MGIQNYSPSTFYVLDKSKIIITFEDVKNIPDLSKYIPLPEIIDKGEIYFNELDIETQNEIIKIYLKYYDFLMYYQNDILFNYTKLKKYWPDNYFLESTFSSKKPELILTINDEEYYFYNIKDLNTLELNYIGVLFFSAFSKIKELNEFVVPLYDFFTDIYFEPNKYSMIKDFKEFFIKEFINFINTSYGSVFGSYNFGSNIKNLIQSKNIQIYKDQVYNDIQGFIRDLRLLYNQFLDLVSLEFFYDNYTLTIKLTVKINDEYVEYQLIKNY